MALSAGFVPETSVYLGFKTIVVDLLKLRHFAAGAGIDVGAGPDGLAVAVIENDPFAHRTAGDGLNIGGREPGGVERLANSTGRPAASWW